MTFSAAARSCRPLARRAFFIHALGCAFFLVLATSGAARALIITEIMYHPTETDEKANEWIEIYNELPDPLDLSGYSICGAVSFEFSPGTWLDGRTFLVVCAKAANVQAKYGISNVVGDWYTSPSSSPSLSNNGEKIDICNAGGKTIATVHYNNRGKWPAGADGTGHSLSLISYYTDIEDPDSWTLSNDLGGTPGATNGHVAGEDAGPPSAAGLDGAGFVLKWLLLGPYTGSSCGNLGVRLTNDWLRETSGVKETDLIWSKNQVVNTDYALAESDALHVNAGTALPTVKEYSSGGDTINLNDNVWPPDPNNVMAYGFVYIDNVTNAALPVDIACASDDAISILVNGVYVHSNDVCRAGGGSGEIQDRKPATLAVGKNLIAVKVFENGGGWNYRLRFENRGTGVPITSRSVIQVTTDHTKGLNFGGGGTPIEPIDPPPPPPSGTLFRSPVILNEAFFRTAGQRWIELLNRSNAAVDLSGYYLTDDRANLKKSRLSSGTTIASGAFLTFTDTQLGLDFSAGVTGGQVFVALVDSAGKRVMDANIFAPKLDGYSEARIQGDNKLFAGAADPTRGAPNAISASLSVVLNEIMYSPIDSDVGKEFIELYNKGAVALDLTGWSISEGIQFDIPPGTVIAADGYLVIAHDPSLFTGVSSIYGLPASQVLGPEQTPAALAAFGTLKNSGERITLSDQLGRTVDTVHYHNGGEWPRWPGGLGSSLELIDANQDNDLGQAWDASDDSSKAQTQTYTYTARHGNRDSELAIILLDRGITLVDDLSMKIGAAEQLTNGTFNSNTTGWVIEGTHIRSGRTTQNAISGAGSLKIIASSHGNNKVDRIETPTAAGVGLAVMPANQDVQISFKARWVVGAQTLLTNGYDHEMAKAHTLAIPLNLGTPGTQNSVTQRLITQTGSSNLGPVITGVQQTPAVPSPTEPVTVSARVLDSDGVGAVSLKYSLNNPSASPTSLAMTRVTGTDFYQATIPAQTQATRVVFFITATDTGGRQGRYPVDVTQRTHPLLLNPPTAGLNDLRYCIYRHDVKNPPTSFQSYRFWMTQANEDELSNRRLQSGDDVDGSFVFGSSTIYYESSTHFSGSPFARAGWNGSFRVQMPKDNPLHGRIKKFGLEDNQGNPSAANTRMSHYLLRQNQGSIGLPYSDGFALVRWQVNDRAVLTREHQWVPDGDLVSIWFPGDDTGDFLEMDDRFLIKDDGTLGTNADGRALYPPPYATNDSNGLNKENYRWFFNLRAKNGADDYSNFMAFAKVMDPGVTNDATFDQQIWNYFNVEEALRMWAVEMNIDDWDSWGQSRGKNLYFYRPELTGQFNMLAWDFELTYGNVNSFIIPPNPTDPFNPGGFSEVNRLMGRPRIRRMFYGILDKMVNGPNRWFHSDHLSDYATRLAAFGMANTGIAQPGGFIDQRAALLQTRIRSVVYPQVRLTITTNGGASFLTTLPAATIAGIAPADVSQILVTTNGDAGTLYTPAFSSMTVWTLNSLPLNSGANALVFYGLDLEGNIVDSDSITVTSTASFPTPVVASLNPASALVGDDIEVLGTGFRNGVKVFFGAVQSPNVVYDENGATPGKIVARVPAGTGTASVTVKNIDNQTSNAKTFTYAVPPSVFVRGDANGDGVVDVSDAVKILRHLFSGVTVDCEDACDVDDNETLNVTDALGLLNYIFKGGVAPKAPFPAEGADPSGSTLDCQR